MHVTDDFTDFSGYFVGQVMELDRENRKASIYLPKLMPAISNSEVRNIKQYTDVGNLSSSVAIDQYVTLTNGLWGRPTNRSNCLPAVGSRVLCFFLESDIKQLYFSPFDVNNDYNDDPKDIEAGYIRQSIN